MSSKVSYVATRLCDGRYSGQLDGQLDGQLLGGLRGVARRSLTRRRVDVGCRMWRPGVVSGADRVSSSANTSCDALAHRQTQRTRAASEDLEGLRYREDIRP